MSNPTGTATPGEVGELFHAGRLGDAVAAANAAVRKAPSGVPARVLLAELLLFADNIERADLVLDACSELDPASALMVAEFRQLLRGEIARRQLFDDGRVPEFLDQPTEAQRLSLEALVALRNGDAAAAGRLAEQAEEARPHPAGIGTAGAFDDLRDGDDLLAPSIEVITTTGKYFWIAPERVESLEFHDIKRPRDLFWRRATIAVEGGPDGDVYVPVLYPPIRTGAPERTDALRLGRATDWHRIGETGPTRGLGAVTLLVGDETRTWLDMENLNFRPTK